MPNFIQNFFTLEKIIFIILLFFFFIFASSYRSYKEETAKDELVKTTKDANGFTYYDDFKPEIGKKINYHKCVLLEASQHEAVYRYAENGKSFLLTIKNGKITTIKLGYYY